MYQVLGMGLGDLFVRFLLMSAFLGMSWRKSVQMMMMQSLQFQSYGVLLSRN